MASKRSKKIVGELEEEIERVMRQLSLRAYQTLTLATPVDTGLARAGWASFVGKRNLRGPTKQRSGQKRETTVGQAASLLAKRSQVAKSISRLYKLRAGKIFIVNKIRYIVFLDQGSSAQAPASFVQTALNKAITATNRTRPS